MHKAARQMSPREHAIDLLARREYGHEELRARLLGKGYAAEDVDQALGMLVEQGLQSDRRFAESFLRGRLMRGQGPVKMLAELGQRGIDRTLAREALAEVEREESVDWYRLASEVLERRFGREVPADAKARARRERFLVGRGFDFDQVREAIRALGDH